MKNTYLMLLSAILLFPACRKKKTVDPVEEPVIYRIKMSRNNIGGSETHYEYDAQGRIIRLLYSGGQVITSEYSNGKVVIKEYTAGGTLTENYYKDLNADGLVSRSYKSPSDGYDEIYTYNSRKELITISSDGNGHPYATTYYYTNGELDSSRLVTAAGLQTRIIYQYDAAVKNTIDDRDKGFLYLTKQHSKAIKKLTYYFYDPSSGNLLNTQINNYAYETDAQGRITRVVLSGGISSDVSYTYY